MALTLEQETGRGFEVLDEEECFSRLGRRSIGRVAVSIGAIPAVFPVNYYCDGAAIYFATGAGTKLAAALRSAVVAFEIDDVDPRYEEGWSVLAVGVAHEVRDEAEVNAMAHHVRPWAPGERSHLVRIRPDFVSGRLISCTPPPAGDARR